MKKLLFVLLFAIPVFAQNARFDSFVIGPKGPVPNATVAVCTQPANTVTTPCTPLATLCSSLTDTACTSPNPVTADNLGNFHFYAKASSGPYTVQVYGPQVAVPYIMPDQFFGGQITGVGNITSQKIENIRFADQYCNTPGTQDQSCINNAIASCPTGTISSGTGCIVYLPYGQTSIASTVTVNTSNIQLVGHGSDGYHDSGTPGIVPGTYLKWTGTAGGTMFQFSSVSGAGNSRISSSGIQDAFVDCASSAAIGIGINSEMYGTYKNLTIYNCTSQGILTGVVAALSEARDTQKNIFQNIRFREIEAASGICIQLDGDLTANTSFNIFMDIECIHKNGTGYLLQDADNDAFYGLKEGAPGGTGKGLILDASGGKNTQANWFFGVAIAGGTVQQNTSTGNQFYGFDTSNGEPAPTISSGTMDWTCNGNNCSTGTSIGKLTLATGISNNSTGFQHKIFGASCTTSSSSGVPCTSTYNWTTTWPDTNYTVSCTIDGANAGIPVITNVTKSTTQINVIIAQFTGVAAQATSVDCIAVHQ